MKNRIFVDSNIWIYLFTEGDGAKNTKASEFILKNAAENLLVISYQVINEVGSVLKRKKYTEQEILRAADDMAGANEVCGFSVDNIYLASMLREQYSFSFWDSHIAASALLSECDILASEDMQDGLVIRKLKIIDVCKNQPIGDGSCG